MSNRWWEITVCCDPVLEESVYWRLEKFGCNGTANEIKGDDRMIRGYLPETKINSLDLAALSQWLHQDATSIQATLPQVQWRTVEEEDWASGWKEHWQPMDIGESFKIVPAWLESPKNSDRLIVRLDPGTAFGTGNHPTTQLCLESLEMRLSQEVEQLKIADIGCGSGILSIASLLLGVQFVHGVDTNSLAVESCLGNAKLNQIKPENFKIEEGSIDRVIATGNIYDGVVCNILAEPIMEIFPLFNKITHEKSWAVLSGILFEQADSLADLIEEEGWTIAALWKRAKWCCFNVRRSEY